jgi:hypothetical protein
MPKSFLVVRCTVSDQTKRAAFDGWYRREHLPQAMEAFRCEKSWRFWSETDPAIHQAVYRFAERGQPERALASDGMKKLIADFDADWPGIPRAREILTLSEEWGGS